MPSRRHRAAALGLVLALAVAGCTDDGGAAPAGNDAGEGIEGVESFRIDGHTHIEGPIDYPHTPPAGGDHAAVWANCGFYDEPVPDPYVVHDLEHGVVWLAYSPELELDDVEVIHDLVGANDKTIATPYDGLEPGEAVVATAWARQLRLDEVNDPRLAAFVDAYQEGSQSPEAGATCRQSPVGEPVP